MSRVADAPDIVGAFPTLDAILADHAKAIGGDLTAYRNHAYRVANLCATQAPPGRETRERIAIAAAFHDLAIWTDHTFDYLEPSVRLAETWLAAAGRDAWTREIVAAIRQHHKLTAYRGGDGPLVEAFRRADWIDVSGGVLRFGLPRRFIRELYARWPDAGFHRLLVRLELRHLRRHPLNPLPVLRF
jgi:hypothetical protein